MLWFYVLRTIGNARGQGREFGVFEANCEEPANI